MPKGTPKVDKITLTKQIKNYFSERILSGAKVDNEVNTQNLTNETLDHFNKGPNHKGWFNKLLKQVLVEKNLSLKDAGFGKTKGDLNFKLIKDESKPNITSNPPTYQPQVTPENKNALGNSKPVVPTSTLPQQQPQGTLPQQQPQGTLPQQTQTIIGPDGQPMMQPIKKVWTQEEKDEMSRIFEKGLGFLGTIYKRTGLVKTKKVESNEPMTEEEFDKEVRELSKGWAEYCIAHDIALPKWIELFMLSAWSIFIFGGPIISLFIGGKRDGQKPKEDSSLKDIKSGEKKKDGEKTE